jgi:outer membrane protein assembly factor BamB
MVRRILLFFIILTLFLSHDSTVQAQTANDWYMAGANPQRTSHVDSSTPNTTQITGQLRPIWYRPLYPYVSAHIQPVMYDNKVFIASSNGLYALNVENGSLEWVFPTELPLGHSPTIVNNVVYIPGMDRTIYAIAVNPTRSHTDSATGYKINDDLKWTFTAPDEGTDLAAGFEVNPLFVNNTLFVGNRNGYFYAVDTQSGTLKWKYKTGGSIRYSAAYHNGVVYFAAMDGHAYALNETTGSLVWKSPTKFPGAGFDTYWPVIYNNYVIFSGSHHFVFDKGLADLPELGGAVDTYQTLEHNNLADLGATTGNYYGPLVTPPAEWPSGSRVVRADILINYTETYPQRRLFFVLNQSNGTEVSFDLDTDGRRDYPPFLWYGVKDGNRYPPIIGPDGTIYTGNHYVQQDWIHTGQVVGWKFNTPLMRLVYVNNTNNIDEPFQWSMGGSMIYGAHFYDGGPACSVNTSATIGNEWCYYDYGNPLRNFVPGFTVQDQKVNSAYDGNSFSPPIPYKNKVFILHNSSIIALANTTTPATSPLPTAQTVSAGTPASRTVSSNQLIQRLEAEILKFDVNGDGTLDHLRPGYFSNGLGDFGGNDTVHNPEMYMAHYFHNPADTMTTLLAALPYLTSATQTKVRTFLQSEYNNYNPCDYSHIGWNSGYAREVYDMLPEVSSHITNFGKLNGDYQTYWELPPQNFYALWKYAVAFGNAGQVFNRTGYGICRNRLSTPPADSFLLEYPYMLNDYINGYTGYIELAKLAGVTPASSITTTLDHLKSIRSNNFQINHPVWPAAPIGQSQYKNILNASRNFIDLSPELGDYLYTSRPTLMQDAVINYQNSIPYWFVSKYNNTSGEGVHQQLFDYPALFQAKAWVLKQPREELLKYLDVPAFERGDLFYMQNLVAAIEASSDGSPTVTPIPTISVSPIPACGPAGDVDCNHVVNLIDLSRLLSKFGQSGSFPEDVDKNGTVNLIDLSILLSNFGKSS